MKVLVTGASGFIAAQIVTDLLNQGHEVTCCVRQVRFTQNRFPKATVIPCDYQRDTAVETWLPRLQDIEVVINAVGILYHPHKKVMWAVHYDTPRALAAACIQQNVKTIVTISALGIEASTTEYAKSKKALDDYLATLPIRTIVIRPSLVYGEGSYGGTSLFRGLVGLPWITPVPGKGTQLCQPIHIKDLSKAILALIHRPPPQNTLFEAAGPTTITLANLLQQLRAWLGFNKSYPFPVPLIFIRCTAWLGDVIPYSTLNSTAYRLLMQNNISDATAQKRFFDAIGFVPRAFTAGLYAQPSQVQDRWHARLYFLKPVLRLTNAFLWIFTALVSVFFYPHAASYALLTDACIPPGWQPFALYGGAAIDALLGIATLASYSLKRVYLAQIGLILFYTLWLTVTLPTLWLHPLAPLAKNLPLLALIMVLLALESDR